MIRVSVSIIEWEGEAGRPGTIPAGARRLGRASMTARPGQQSILLLGQEGGGEALLDGLRLEIEPNIGANDDVIDLRFSLERGGAKRLLLSQGTTLAEGVPVVLRLGRLDRKSLGAVLEARVIDPSGEAQ